MFLRRRALATVLAATAAFSLAACGEADNGNNTLANRKTDAPPPSTSAPGAPQSTAPARPPAGGPVELEAKDNVFAPEKLTAAAGDIVVKMHNGGQAPHTFTAADLKADVNADAGKDVEIKLTGVKPGTYKFVCKYHESLNPPMVGELTVT